MDAHLEPNRRIILHFSVLKKFLFIYLFIWPHWVFTVVSGLSLVEAVGLLCRGVASLALKCGGFRSCGAQA